jgi:hypothetical protein
MTCGRGRGFGLETCAVASIAVNLLAPHGGGRFLCS